MGATSAPPTIRPAAGARPHPQSQLERAVAGRKRGEEGGPGRREKVLGRIMSRPNSWLFPVRAVLFLSRPSRSEKENLKLLCRDRPRPGRMKLGSIRSRGNSWLLLARRASTSSVSSSDRSIVKVWTREATANVRRRSNQDMAGWRNRGMAGPRTVYM